MSGTELWRVAYDVARTIWSSSEEALRVADVDRGYGHNTTDANLVPSSSQRPESPVSGPPVQVGSNDSWRWVCNAAQPTGVELQRRFQGARNLSLGITKGIAKRPYTCPKMGAIDQEKSQTFHFPYRSDSECDAVRLVAPELAFASLDSAFRVSSTDIDFPDDDEPEPKLESPGRGEHQQYSPENTRGRSPRRNMKRRHDGSPAKRTSNAGRSQSNMRGRSRFRRAGVRCSRRERERSRRCRCPSSVSSSLRRC